MRQRDRELHRLLTDSHPTPRRWELLCRLLRGWPARTRDAAITTAQAGLATWPEALRIPVRNTRPIWPLIKTLPIASEDAFQQAIDNPDLSPSALVFEQHLTEARADRIAKRWPNLRSLTAPWSIHSANMFTRHGGFSGLQALGGAISGTMTAKRLAEAELPGLDTWILRGDNPALSTALRCWMKGAGLPSLRNLDLMWTNPLSDRLLAKMGKSERMAGLTGLALCVQSRFTPDGLRSFLQADGLCLKSLNLWMADWGDSPIDGLFEEPALQTLQELRFDGWTTQPLWQALMHSPMRRLQTLSVKLGAAEQSQGVASAVLASVRDLSLGSDRTLLEGGWLSSPHLAGLTRLHLDPGYLHRERMEELLAGPALEGLEVLELSCNFSTETLGRLSSDPRLSTLHTALINRLGLTTRGLCDFLASPHLHRLVSLKTGSIRSAWKDEELTAETAAVERLADSRGLARLFDLQLDRWHTPQSAHVLRDAAGLHPDVRARLRRVIPRA